MFIHFQECPESGSARGRHGHETKGFDDDYDDADDHHYDADDDVDADADADDDDYDGC